MLWDNNKNIKMIGQHDPDDLERSNNCAVRGFWNGTLWAAITSAAMGGEHYYYTRVKGKILFVFLLNIRDIFAEYFLCRSVSID